MNPQHNPNIKQGRPSSPPHRYQQIHSFSSYLSFLNRLYIVSISDTIAIPNSRYSIGIPSSEEETIYISPSEITPRNYESVIPTIFRTRFQNNLS